MQLRRRDSAGYQQLLVGTWAALCESVPNGILLLSDDSPTAIVRLDALIDELRKRNLIDAQRLSRFACGAQIASLPTSGASHAATHASS